MPRAPSWPNKWVALAVCLAAVVGVLGFSARPRDPDELLVAGQLTRLLLGSSLAGAGVVLLVRSRYFQHPAGAWLASAHLALACYLLPHAIPAMMAVSPGTNVSRTEAAKISAESLSVHLADVSIAVVTALLLVAALGRRPAQGLFHPLLVGPVLGVSLSLVRIRTDAPTPEGWLLFAALTGLLLCSAAAAVSLFRVRRLSGRVKSGMLAALSLIVIGSCFPQAALDDPTLVWLVVLANAGAAVLLPGSALLALQDTISAHLRRVVQLEERAADAQTTVDRDRELLHELRASLAGINGAQALLRRPADALPDERVVVLRRLLETEMERMLLLLEQDEESQLAIRLDLDREIGSVVERHHSLGLDVTHVPSGVRALAVRPHLQIALNVLLHNVMRHAPGARCTVSVHRAGPHVELRVADEGPGVEEALRGVVFQRGTRSALSPGEGVGLHSARRLLRQHDGNLHLEHSDVGAVFVITLRGAQ